jgi:CSLREA domain-containing protein
MASWPEEKAMSKSTQVVKRSLLGLCALLLANTTPAVVTTIQVTTLDDENGSGSACSLREALFVVNSKSRVAWGGCSAGNPVGENIIQLQAGTYRLSGELSALTSVTIAGKDTVITEDDESTSGIDESINLYTGKTPNRIPPVTIIDAEDGSRILSSMGAASGSTVTLRDLELRNGKAEYVSQLGNGGAIYAATSLALDNVIIRNSDALGVEDVDDPAVIHGGQGGAIFLSKTGVGLSLTNATLEANTAQGTGGAVAMICAEDLAAAAHTLVVTSSLLADNESARGAGVMDVCGDTSLQMSNSTLAANKSYTANPGANPGYGAVTYLQSVADLGSVNLTNLTAAKHDTGAVLALAGVASANLDNSFFIGNAGGNCDLDAAVSFPSGNYNSIDDNSCDALLLASGASGQANQHPPTGQFSNELNPLDMYGGLTRVYLLKANAGSSAWNMGTAGDSCTGEDQRGLSRKNGARCDIGAVERLEPTPVDDDAENGSESRVVVVDVLANDSFGETNAGPNKFADPAIDNDLDVVSDLVTLPDGVTTRKICVWYGADASNEDYRNKLVVDNLGVITDEDDPVVCTYKFRYVNNGSTTAQPTTTTATVRVSVSNIAPRAVNDVYVRRLGETDVALDLLSNDSDPDDPNAFDSPFNLYPIYIASPPVLGKLIGQTTYCPDYDPDSSSEPKLCYAPGLKYVNSNAQSPFTDSFQYKVYDDDALASNTATVTIRTNAPDRDKGEGGGSMDMLMTALLALLGLRRARKL